MKKPGLYGERTFFISSLLLYCPGAFILHLPLLVIAVLSKSPVGQTQGSVFHNKINFHNVFAAVYGGTLSLHL